MAVVEVRGLTKEFDGSVRAVDGIDIGTEEGEFLVLLGPSGCGKTTLLRMIAGLERPSSGEIYIEGRPVAGLPPRARKIAMVFQSYALYPHKSIRDNIEFPLKALRFSKAERADKARWAAELLDIGRLLDRKPRHLSGGEQQRVALARALVREPNVFLLDEPLSNLDAKLRATARDDLKDFQQRVGTTTIYVTHDQVEAMSMGDRIAVLSAGRLRQLGKPHEIYHDPADIFVATFVGSPPMNVVPMSDFQLGFRPETLQPKAVSEPGGDDLSISFDVQRVEYLGSERHLVGTIDRFGPDVRVRSVLPANVTVPLESGESYPFLVHGRDLRFFDAESGERIPPRRV
ncbi:MAG: ABC transporter ATP-binding protein [Streptosporangiaceae bacterium]